MSTPRNKIERKQKRLEKQRRRQQSVAPTLGELSPWQVKCSELFKVNDLLVLSGPPGTGKSHMAAFLALTGYLNGTYNKIYLIRPAVESGEALGFLPGPQPISSSILTPSGWTTMGNLKVNDFVIGRDGKPTKVLDVFPKGSKDVYKITTTDGTSTECCEDHLFLTKTWEEKKRNKSGKVKSLKEIKDTIINDKGKLNHYLPRNKAVEFNENILDLSPYVLGCLLGDGSFTTDGNVSLINKDKHLISRVKREIKSLGCSLSNSKNRITYNIIDNNKISNKPSSNLKLLTKTRWSNKVKIILDKLGLHKKYSYEKFIPDIYKYGSIKQRLALLQGLMDTDGTIKTNGEASFSTTSLRLANDVIEITRSLGGRATLKTRNRIGKKSLYQGRFIKSKRLSYEFNISLPKELNPFYIPRKASRHKSSYIYDARISSIEYLGKKEVKCILLDNPEHLYITDDYIVTHNTVLEKLTPYLMPYFEFLEKFGINPKQFLDNKIIEPCAIAHLKGRTLDNAIIIFDEAQDCSKEQLRLVLSRMGANAKMIITGDPDQVEATKSKIPNDTFYNFVQDLIDVKPPGVVVAKLKESHIVRHKVIKDLLTILDKN